ncbi:MAG TPA: 23S rRNA (pseudouridine(1915)-N(3))-methyltransferase RlmH [Saprospiraceae bacterium]|nr:23S rRNA (pseudouridine(1915)-N(3))-methyltransferase RlmH [Saprospiraceae bacterium]
MKVEFWLIGKTKETWVRAAIDHYLKRCSRYCTIKTNIIPDSKHTLPVDIRKDETARIVASLRKGPKGFTVMLDEKGKELNSVQFADLISKQQSAGHSTLRFIIGGAFGVEDLIHQETDLRLSLSSMTFPHQLVRIIFLEQLYRAFTILRGEGYHHE